MFKLCIFLKICTYVSAPSQSQNSKASKTFGLPGFLRYKYNQALFFFVFGGFLTRKLVPDVDSTVGQIQTGQESGTFWKSGRGRSSNLVGRICPPPPSWSVNILGACPPPSSLGSASPVQTSSIRWSTNCCVAYFLTTKLIFLLSRRCLLRQFLKALIDYLIFVNLRHFS